MNYVVDKQKVIELAAEWEEIWKTRPFENSNGLGCQGAFALYYFLKEMDPAPELVVECGTWRGFSTWVIRMAVPDAKIICSDPILASRQFLKPEVFTPEYRVKDAEYTWQDFSNIEINIPEEKKERAVVFFDDHQNKIPRLEQAIKKGFKHIIYDDNVPYKYTHTSFEYLFEVERDESVKKYLSRYTVFPPIYSGRHKNGVFLNGLLSDKEVSFPNFYEGRDIYSWVTKISVSDFCFRSREGVGSEVKVDGISGKKNVHELTAFLENTLVKRRSANHALPGELIVSLTSYKPRFGNLHLTLKSLLLQKVAPNRLILWVAENERNDLPQSVLELQDDGLDICFCEDLLSYKKIVPTLLEYPESFIVTADDDIYYEPNWLKGLIDGWDGDYKTVVAHRAHKIKLDKKGSPLPYRQWNWQIGAEEPVDGLIFPTGCGGVLYPPNVFHAEVTNTEKFMTLCPSADDVWLYWMASLNGAKAKRSNYDFHLIEWPQGNVSPLWHENIQGGGNDKAIKKMFQKYGVLPYENEGGNITFSFNGKDVFFYLPNKQDHIQEIIRSTNSFYEVEMLKDVISRIKKSDVVLDIGANIGNHTIFISSFSEVSRVLAFEPHPKTFETLKKNIDLNSLGSKVTCFNVGLSSKPGNAVISFYDEKNIGMSRLEKSKSGEIKLLCVDDVVKKEGVKVGLMKVDVEGMELSVLKGSQRVLQEDQPILYIEAGNEEDFVKLKEYLSKFDYQPRLRFNATPTYLFIRQDSE